MNNLDCAAVHEADLVPRYLGGRLGEAEVEQLEAHALDCDRCWAEIQAGGEIRAAGSRSVARFPEPRSRSRFDIATLLAAAAAAAVIAIGLRQLVVQSENAVTPSVWRGSAQALALDIAASPSGGLVLHWTEAADARTYVVEVFDSSGTSVLREETTETSRSFGETELPPPTSDVWCLVKVEARDGLGQVVAKSALTPVAKP
jgi:hypothetical protein